MALVRWGGAVGGEGCGCRAGGPRPGELQGRGELLPSELRKTLGAEWLVGEGEAGPASLRGRGAQGRWIGRAAGS